VCSRRTSRVIIGQLDASCADNTLVHVRGVGAAPTKAWLSRQRSSMAQRSQKEQPPLAKRLAQQNSRIQRARGRVAPHWCTPRARARASAGSNGVHVALLHLLRRLWNRNEARPAYIGHDNHEGLLTSQQHRLDKEVQRRQGQPGDHEVLLPSHLSGCLRIEL